MTTCCDTSFLYSSYEHDAHSKRVVQYITCNSNVITLTPFNRYELANALHLSEFRKILSKGDATRRLANFEKDLRSDLFVELPCNLATILSEAQRLSANYVAKKGYRAFDIIHIAAALYLEADIFLTFDEKQRELAKSQGLKTPL